MKLINRNTQVQILAIIAFSGELLTEMAASMIGTPGKGYLDAAIAGLRDLDTMSKSQEYTSKQRRAKLAEVNAQIAQAIAFATAPGMTLRAFSEHNYTVTFTAVQKFVAYAQRNGISLVEQNPISLVVRALNNVLASAIDSAATQQPTWYEVVLQAFHGLFADIVASVTNRQLRPAFSAFTYVGFEPAITAEIDAPQANVNAPVATNGEELDDTAGESWKQGVPPVAQFGAQGK